MRTNVSRSALCAPKTWHQLRIDFGLLNNSLRFDHTRTHAHTKPIKASVRIQRRRPNSLTCAVLSISRVGFHILLFGRTGQTVHLQNGVLSFSMRRRACGRTRTQAWRMNGMYGWNYWPPSIRTRLTDRKLQVYGPVDWPSGRAGMVIGFYDHGKLTLRLS